MKPKTVRELRAKSAPQSKPSGRVAPLAGRVSGSKQTDEVLRLFRTAMDVSADMIMLVDRATMRYIDVNATACEMQGYTREAMLRMGPQDVSPFSKEALERAYDETIASGATTRQESYHHRKDGTRFPVEICRRAVREGGRWIIVSIVRDISERMRAEQLQNLEHAVARSLAEAESASAVVTAVISTICKTDGWECGRYFSVDDGADVLRFSAGWGAPDPAIERFLEDSRDIVYARGSGLVGKVWQSGAPVWTDDVTSDPRAQRAAVARELGIRSVFVFPVISEGKTIGVLAFSSRKVREPDERLLRAAHAIGSQIGQFLQRKQAEDSLRAKENRFRRLTELTSDVYWEQDDQYRFTSFSDTGPDTIKSSNYRRLGKKRWEQNYVNMSATDWAAHIAALDARAPFHDLELCRLNEAGEKIWIRVSGEPVFDASGVFKGYHGVAQDITARKREERLLMLEHAVARCLTEADSAPAGIKTVIRAVCESEGWECGRYWRVDEAAGVLRFSESWNVPDAAIERFIAEKREAVVGPGIGLAGRAWQSGEPAWTTDIVRDAGALQAAITLDTSLRGAYHFPVKADGKTIGVMAFNSRKIREPDQRLLQSVRVIGSQIGQFLQRKQAEEVLRESEARFRSLTDLSSDWYWEQDEHFRFTKMSQELLDETGISSTERLGKTRWELPAINLTEADWAAHRALLEAHKPFHDLEICRLGRDGRLHYGSTSGEPVFDADGAFKGYRGVGKDITARKREEQMQALEHAVTRSLAEAESVSAALKAVIRSMCEAQGWECGRYFNCNDRAGVLEFKESWHVPSAGLEHFIEQSRELTYAPAEGLVGRVFQSGQPMWVADIGKDNRVRKGIARDAGMHGTLLFPVISEGKPIGVLSYHSKTLREPDERLLRAIHIIGSQIGQFLRRKEAEEKVWDHARQQRLMAEFCQQAFASADLEEVLNRAVQLVSGALNVEYANVLELDSGGKRLTHRAAVGWPRAWLGQRVVEIEPGSRLDLVLSRSEPVVVDDFNAETDRPASPLAQLGIRSGVRAPILGARSAYGILSVHERKPRRFTGEEVSFLQSVASILAIAIERKQAEEVLRESEVRFRATFDSAPVGIMHTSIDDDRILHANPKLCEMLGYARDELLALRTDDVIHPEHVGEDRPKYREKLLRGEMDDFSSERRYVRKDGSSLWVHRTVSLAQNAAGDPLYFIRIVEDITERTLSARRREMEYALTQVLAESATVEVAMPMVLRTICEALEWACGAYWKWHETEELLRCAETWHTDAEGLAEFAAATRENPNEAPAWQGAAPGTPTGGVVRRVWFSGAPAWFADVMQQPGFRRGPVAARAGLRSAFGFPILAGTQPLGVMEFYSHDIKRPDEPLLQMVRAIGSHIGQFLQRKNAEDRLTQLAQFDTVTGLPNRYLFTDRLGQMLTQAQRNDWLVGALFVDLDRFKAVNDTYGHDVGDKLLRQVAARLKECVRGGDTVGRLSGDEFAVVLPNLAKADDAGLVAQKIVSALAASFDLDGRHAYISASIGIALYPGDGAEPDLLIKNADTAMYRAKQRGRNGYQYYLPEMNERLMQRMQLEAQLRGALERNEFLLHYQPKVNLDSGAITGFEALLRWRHGDRTVSPAEFIPILEDTGLIVPVGEWVLRSACEQIRQWQQQGVGAQPVAVNLSTRQFQRENLPAVVGRTLAETGIRPELLELELTETLLMSDAEEAVQMLHQLKSLGVRLTVDDFGTGYSSLAYLKRFPLDVIKIDRAFIRDVTSDPDDATITLAIISLARNLKLKVVAEGVETEGQLNFLKSHGCDEMQGFYFARPLPAEDSTRMLIEGRRLERPPGRLGAEVRVP